VANGARILLISSGGGCVSSDQGTDQQDDSGQSSADPQDNTPTDGSDSGNFHNTFGGTAHIACSSDPACHHGHQHHQDIGSTSSTSSAYDSGYKHGRSDARLASQGVGGTGWYITQPGKGFAFHTTDFRQGYVDGFCSIAGSGAGSDADQASSVVHKSLGS